MPAPSWSTDMAKGTPIRNLRIADDLWLAVKAKAERQGTDVSTVIRDLLARWVRR